MTEITRAPFVFEITPLEKILTDTKILLPDRDKAVAYMDEVGAAHVLELQNVYKKEHPFIHLLLAINSYWIMFGVMGVAALFIWFKFFFISFAFGCMYAICGVLLDFAQDKREKEKAQRFWRASPFTDFEKEYRGDAVSRISGCSKTSGCVVTLFTFKVYHHPASSRRFLVVIDTSDKGCLREYFCDFWDESIPKVSFDNQWVSKSAELS